MRCIEIRNADTYDRVGGRINSNMRCIEITDPHNVVSVYNPINSNMRCIEITLTDLPDNLIADKQ